MLLRWRFVCVFAVILMTNSIRCDDPEAKLKPPQMINYWGYPSQVVEVITDDGYILNMHRIQYGKAGPTNCGQRPVVFLQHGLLATSSSWVTGLPQNGLGYLLADAGFDVFLGNVRGVEYSLGHTHLRPNSREYWQFSWDEMVHHDLDAMINTALNITGQSSLYYAGHSQGTLIMFSKLADDQTFATKIRLFFALGPIGTVKHIKGLLAFIADYFYDQLDILYHIIGDDISGLTEDNWLYDLIKKLFCGSTNDELCASLIGLVMGPDSSQLNKTRLPVFLSDEPGGTSTRNFIHFAQMIRSGNQQEYDYENSLQNNNHYGQSRPPIYDIHKVNVPTYLYYGDEDWLADATDIDDHILPGIPSQYLVNSSLLTGFSHIDFIWGQRAPNEVYQPIIDTIKQDARENYKDNKCF